MALGVIAAILSLLLTLAGASMALTGSVAFSQPSPSGSGSPSAQPTEPQIFLLNPNPSYDPKLALTEPPREPESTDNPNPTDDLDPPKISDEFDGVDQAYHVVAVVTSAPEVPLIEAYYAPRGENEVTVGQLSPVPGSDDTYEFFWDISEATLNAGFGTFTVRMFAETPGGFEEVAADEVPVRLQHEDSLNLGEPLIEEAETVELAWPSQNGPIGFYKDMGAAGQWRTVVNGTTTLGVAAGSTPETGNQGIRPTYQVRIHYSVTPIGDRPVYTQCGSVSTSGVRPEGYRTFMGTCTLVGKDVPSKITAMAAVAIQDQDADKPSDVGANPRQPTQEGADAHRVVPYLQQVEDLKVGVTSQTSSQQPSRRHEVVQIDCLGYEVKVTDLHDRPVQGANVDIHVQGPTDQVGYGDETRNGAANSGKQPPAKGHSSEAGRDCESAPPGDEFGLQGDHNVPGGPDVKHLESTLGTGLSGGATASFGEWFFYVISPNVGDSEITAWVDDAPLLVEADKRAADDDTLGATEVRGTNFAQWFTAAPAVTIDPTGATAAAGTCQRFVIRVRGGSRPVREANVDVHATGPDNELDFCDPGDASVRRAPETGVGHNAEDIGEVTHAGQPPVAQHTEGETNAQGNFIVGITSPVPGDTTLTAWYDSGEAPFDNDEQAGGEAFGTAATNWVASTGDAAISFLNPSPYGNAGTNVGNKQDVDAAYHIVTRVSSIEPVAGVELFYRSGTDPLVKIADAARVNETDAYEAYWGANVPDGSYTLVARIRDTAITAEQTVTVNNTPTATNPQDIPFETVEITSPLDGQRASFVRGKLSVRGVASAGAEGVNLYYTKAGSLTTPAAGAWTQCGTSTLPSGSSPKEFTLDCALAGADQPGMVTGVAAVAYNCLQGDCRAAAARSNHSGDAHRVFGSEANPLLSVEPAETVANTGVCQKFVVTLQDQTGQPISSQNLDAHLSGPGSSGNFCSPDDGTGTERRAPDQGSHTPDGNETDEGYHDEGGVRTHHTESETTGNGRFVFGIESETAGDAQLTVWLDANDDDVQGQDEVTDISVMHWETVGVCDITGTNGPDTLTGTDAPEKICGFGGNDTITGGGGNDTITGGAGNDLLRGNAANDSVRGGPGADRVFGGGGSDRLAGGGGNDVVKGHRSNDRLRGNAGKDRLDGGTGRDDCGGGRGRDRMRRCETGSRTMARPRLI